MPRGSLVGIGFAAGVVLVCDLAVVGVHLLDDHTALVTDRTVVTVIEDEGTGTVVPRAGQAFVTGTALQVTADGAQVKLATPLTLTALVRGGGGATIEGALVGGKRVDISWDGGTPLPISGSGGLDLGPTLVEVSTDGLVYHLEDTPRQFLPGTYTLGTAVAVGSGSGLAEPREGVRFTADARTVIAPKGKVVVRLGSRAVELTGPGKVKMAGTMKVQFPDRTTDATAVDLVQGPYKVTLEPAAGGLRVDAVLQGQVAAR